MGIPVDIGTNSESILAVADRLWLGYPAVSGRDPVTLRVVVQSGVKSAAFPSLLGQEHLMSIIGDAPNFAVCDLAASFGYARVTRDVALDGDYFRYHFLEAAIYTMMEARYFCPVHASCIALDGRAILLCGDSGAGKTSLAYACAKKGWTFLSGDATCIVRDHAEPSVAGRPFSIRFRSEARDLFPELGVFTPERRANGKFDIEIDTQELGLTTALESRPVGIVFLNRQRTGAVRINSFSREEAFEQCSRAICYGNEDIRGAQKKALRGFLTLPVAELTYSGLDEAESALRGTVRAA